MKLLAPFKRLNSAFTLAECLVGLAILGIVAGVSVGSYVTLQRGYVFIYTASDLNASLRRVQDSIEVDLRNATTISISSTSAIQTLTLSVPRPYSAYYTGTGVRAGEPSAVFTSGSINTTSGALTYSGSMAVVYSGSISSTNARSYFERTATWSGTTAKRIVATFSNGANLFYKVGNSGTDGTVTYSFVPTTGTTLKTSDTAVSLFISGTTNDLRRPLTTGTLQDTIYLRAHNLQ